jgi:hypothetical protein
MRRKIDGIVDKILEKTERVVNVVLIE